LAGSGYETAALDQATTFQHLADTHGALLDQPLQLVRAGPCHRAEQRRVRVSPAWLMK